MNEEFNKLKDTFEKGFDKLDRSLEQLSDTIDRARREIRNIMLGGFFAIHSLLLVTLAKVFELI